MKGIMLQGTASDVGKSVLATGVCRLLARRGKKVAPFKSQNMSNNSYVTKDGKEIGRAQGIQAEAAKTDATVYMNPILLKPKSDSISEVIRLGKRYERFSGRAYRERFYELGIETIKTSLDELSKEYEYIVIEGAGSPVEINLNDREIVNMKVAELADVPVFLIADIDRGGVFASVVGTLALLSEAELARVKGVIINKFRGDLELFVDGVRWLEEKTGKKIVGVVPYLQDVYIEGEDSLSLQTLKKQATSEMLDIAVISLPYVSNYTDLEPFRYESDVALRFVKKKSEFGQPDAVIIPGTTSTLADFSFLKEAGLDEALTNYANSGGTIVGLCGGYQMLGETLIDEAGTDSGEVGKTLKALGILPIETSFTNHKTTIRSKGKLVNRGENEPETVTGFEIHLGETRKTADVPSFVIINEREEGIKLDGGRIIGTYFHHLFHNDDWRTFWLNQLRKKRGLEEQQALQISAQQEIMFERLADHLEAHLDVDYLEEVIEAWTKQHA